MAKFELILDNSVLSSFNTADWLPNLDFMTENCNLRTSARIRDEYANGHPHAGFPESIDVNTVSIPDNEDYVYQLGNSDASLIKLAQLHERSVVVTNDQILKRHAENQELETMWGSVFLKEIFISCGIHDDEFRSGLNSYVSDLWLTREIEPHLRSLEKR